MASPQGQWKASPHNVARNFRHCCDRRMQIAVHIRMAATYLRMYIYMYIYICMYIYIYTCIYVYIYKYMYIYISIYLHIYLFIIYLFNFIHVYIYMCVCAIYGYSFMYYLFGQHLCYAPNSFGMIVILGDRYGTCSLPLC